MSGPNPLAQFIMSDPLADARIRQSRLKNFGRQIDRGRLEKIGRALMRNEKRLDL
jgi:hypothetical protein